MPLPIPSNDQKVMLHLILIILMNAVVTFTTPFASHDANAGASGVTLPKSHVVPYFDHLDLRNAIVPLIMLSASHDADGNAMASHDTNANGVM